jgi:hypothetical protein
VNLDLRHTTSLADMNACDVVPTADDLGIDMARIIAPGNASRSVLVERMKLRDENGMPPLGSTIDDVEGWLIVTAWIQLLSSCN